MTEHPQAITLKRACEIASEWKRPGPHGSVSDADFIRIVWADDAQLTRALNGDAKAHNSYAQVGRDLEPEVSRAAVRQRAVKIVRRLRYHLEAVKE